MRFFIMIIGCVLLGTYVFLGTLSPCDFVRERIRERLANKESELGSIFSAMMPDSMINAALADKMGGMPTPYRCTVFLMNHDFTSASETEKPQHLEAKGTPRKESTKVNLIENGRLCTQEFPILEQQYSIPTHLMAAMSVTESGRRVAELDMDVPWPWTISVNGQKSFFDTKEQAVEKVAKLKTEGVTNVSVGCMQVPVTWQINQLRDANDVLDPKRNMAIAARKLKDNFDQTGDWPKAAALYHSADEVQGKRYLAQVESNWNRIVERVRKVRNSSNTVSHH